MKSCEFAGGRRRRDRDRGDGAVESANELTNVVGSVEDGAGDPECAVGDDCEPDDVDENDPQEEEHDVEDGF